MYKISTTHKIAAAHQLRNYEGPCARLHGHNWQIKVDVIVSDVNDLGITIDFVDLDKIIWKVVGKFDHQNFNAIEPFDKINPSAENIAKYFYGKIKTELAENIQLAKVSIWETDQYLVEYYE